MTTKSEEVVAPTIERILVLSTAHLDGRQTPGATRPDENDTSYLHGDAGPLVCYENDYGWFLYVPSDPGWAVAFQKLGVPRRIIDMMIYAEDQGCQWIKFDADGPEMPQFPTFHW